MVAEQQRHLQVQVQVRPEVEMSVLTRRAPATCECCADFYTLLALFVYNRMGA